MRTEPPDVVEPFARGSVSIRLYPHNDLDPTQIVDEMCAQAQLALACGFDGVTTSEHHGGFAGYLAQPLQMASFILSTEPRGWAAPAPILMPLRSTALVAEEVAWLNARYPRRVGIAVAAGSLPLDFEVAGVDPGRSAERFKSELPRLVSMLSGEHLGKLDGDPALRACRKRPVPVLSAAVSTAAARRAARCGAGILMEGMSDGGRLAELTAAFDEAGGTGSKVLIRRVWLGELHFDLVRRQRAVYDSYSGTAAFGEDQTVCAAEPAEIAQRLCTLVEETRSDALDLRVHLPGVSAGEVREQIAALGAGVVGAVKEAWAQP